MPPTIQANNVVRSPFDFWYHGFTYNATVGSRAAITTVIAAGMVMCMDPFAYAQDKTFQDANAGATNLPVDTDYGQMVLKPEPGVATNARYVRNITRPDTATLGLFAGIVKGPHPDMIKYGAQSAGAGPQWLTLITGGEEVLVQINGAVTAGDLIIPVSGQFYGVSSAVGTNGANIPNAFGKVLVTDAGGGTRLLPVRLFGPNGAPVG